jgi:hypothetical protein
MSERVVVSSLEIRSILDRCSPRRRQRTGVDSLARGDGREDLRHVEPSFCGQLRGDGLEGADVVCLEQVADASFAAVIRGDGKWPVVEARVQCLEVLRGSV